MLEHELSDAYFIKADSLEDQIDLIKGKITRETFHICRLLHENTSDNRFNPVWSLESNGRIAGYIDKATSSLDSIQKAILHTAIEVALRGKVNLNELRPDLQLGTIAAIDERILAQFEGILNLDGANAARLLKRLFPANRVSRHQL